ncbi:MAG TPA: ATP-grasp domain-containing protein, partial [Planctomycetaceae bacterium]|nr:ATP-grasp domain-containing protein [Planctomycetaceae bacterium]
MTRQQDERCLLIVGASTRAAAFSALRAKWQPVCIAKFLDEDLKAVARVLTWPRTLRQVVTLAKSLPECPWLYTGAVENHPALIDAISQSRPLWGNPGDVVRAVRDPFRVARVLQDHDIPALELRPAHDPPRPDGTWLVKPLQGAGGCGIAAWQGSRCDQRVARTAFFQRRVDGASLSAVFVANGAEAKRAGVTWQLIGVPSSQSAPFAYCGSIGPVVGAGPDDTDTNGQGGDARSTLHARTA